MQQSAQKISSQQARNLFPLQKLTQDDTEELLRTAITTRFAVGAPLFRNSDLPKQIFYLISGEVELLTRDKGRRMIKGGTLEARKPLGRGITGQLAATARQESLVISFDADMLELFLSWTNPEAYLVSEMQTSHSGEWLERLLQSRGLLRFSEEQIQTLLNRMSEVHHLAGDVIIHQNDPDDYYYIIKNGRCSVTRQPHAGAKGIKLAELQQGDAFGEEALLANAPRSANITMIEDGDLMRLAKADFSKLLAEPLLNSVSWSDSHNLIALGATFLDIRLPEEFAEQHLPDSINIPLALLRLKLKQLSHNRKYSVCCNDGSRSAVATFLLNRHGFDAFILDGGLTSSPESSTYAAEQTTTVETEDFDIQANPWGSTGDTAQQSPFDDVPNIENFNKTQPLRAAATVIPINQARPQQKPQPQPTVDADIDFIMEQAREARESRRSSYWIRGTIIAALAVAAIAIGAAFATNLLGNNTPRASLTQMAPPSIAVAQATTTIDTTPTPWSDSADNQLIELLGAPLDSPATQIAQRD
jgi:CRP-like cAMP-binding protein